MEGEEGVAVEIPSLAENRMELTLPREYFTVYMNRLVQFPPTNDASLHPPLEGHGDVSAPPNYGPDDPFWRTSMGQAIAEFRVIIPSPGNPTLGEEE